MIERLTPEQEAAADQIVEEYVSLVLGGDDTINREVAQEGLDFCYGLAKLKPPRVELCADPKDLAVKGGLKPGEFIDGFGQGFDSGWTAFYDYMQRVVGVTYDPEWGFDIWLKFIRESGVFATVLRESVAYVCPRPLVVSRTAGHQLHCEDGPAIRWRSGYGLYFLNGVLVPEVVVMTRPELLDCVRWVAKERNAEVRREVVKKVGIERVCLALKAKTMDRWVARVERRVCTGGHWTTASHEVPYELLFLDIGDGRRRPYLKMTNPSIGVYHIEGVDPRCRTVKEALAYRNGTDEAPGVLT